MKKLILVISLCLFFSTISVFAADSPWFIDLNKQSLYIKVGFEASDTNVYPDEENKNWVIFPPAEKSGRVVRPLDIELPEIPKPRFFSFKTYEKMDFTYSLPFELEIPANDEVPGLHLGSLGDNWEIFLNGQLIRSSVDLNDNGQIRVHHSRRDIFFPIKPSLFNNGMNLLVIHIMCDPSYEANGFHQAKPYYFDSYEKISQSNGSILTFALLFLYLFMGIYHIFLYLNGRSYRYNLFYGLFSITLFFYLFMRTHVVYSLIADTNTVFKIELIFLFCLLPFISAFLELITVNKISGITKGFSLYSLILGITAIFTPINFNLDLLRIWQITGLIMILYIFFYLICWNFFTTAYRHWKSQRNLEKAKGRIRIVLKTLYDTDVGNLFIGTMVLFGTTTYDILDSMFFENDLVLTNYGFLFFTLGSAFILANRFAFLHKQMSDLNYSLELKIKEVETASEKSRISEIKYRSLFEGNSDAVLLLNEEFSILEGNEAGLELLGIKKKNITSHSIFNSLYFEEKEDNHSKDLLRLKLDELLLTENPTELKLRFTGKRGEMKAVRVRLELIHTLSSTRQILFRAILIQEDALLSYFCGEKIHYQISNSFPLTDEVSRRITANLAKYMEKAEAEMLFIGIREIIINAIEHGNLCITFAEKTKSQAEGRFMELLMDRQKEPMYCDKKVKIEASISPEKVIYRICDEGPGFDHKTFLKSTRHQVNETLSHGRGISMAMQLFDKVYYNEKGNQVTLIKKIRP
ncbi:MAG: ATP-binding protein [Spirochaetaceae bacterium]|nr:ATP-binding protein [Spirochaetaceae bacterium]